eukprot:scaffold14557_cov114-Isochrysis_galbana.AAC.2
MGQVKTVAEAMAQVRTGWVGAERKALAMAVAMAAARAAAATATATEHRPAGPDACLCETGTRDGRSRRALETGARDGRSRRALETGARDGRSAQFGDL